MILRLVIRYTLFWYFLEGGLINFQNLRYFYSPRCEWKGNNLLNCRRKKERSSADDITTLAEIVVSNGSRPMRTRAFWGPSIMTRSRAQKSDHHHQFSKNESLKSRNNVTIESRIRLSHRILYQRQKSDFAPETLPPNLSITNES